MKYNTYLRDSFGQRLEVVQEIPEKGNKFPTILMVSGFGMDLHEYGYFDEVSGALVRNGFQTFRFSFEGTGKSEGNFEEMTIDTQAQQVKDVLEYIKKDRFTQKRKIGVYAQSFGAATVVAGLPYTGIKTVLFTSAPAHPEESIAKWFRGQRGYVPEGISEIERSDKRKTRVGPPFWKSLTSHNLTKEIKHLTQPILFIHGSLDFKVRGWEAEEYYNAVPGRKKLHVMRHADHAFTGKFRPTVIKLITDWFEETLG